MVLGEAGNDFFLVLVYTPDEVVGYADVDCPMFASRQDVDVEMSDHGECRVYGSRRSLRSAGMTTALGALEIRLECVDRHLQRGIGVGAPELTRVEYHRVEPLRIVAAVYRGRVRKNLRAVIALDDPDMPAHIARQAGVRDGIDVPAAHALADRKL